MTTKLGSYYLIFGEKSNKLLVDKQRNNLLKSYKGAQEIFINTKDNILLNGMIINQPKSLFSFFKKKRLLIYFNGRKSSYEKLDGQSYISNAHKLGYDVLLFNYRGIRKSQGSPTPEGLIKDGQAVLNYSLSQNYKSKNIIIHGFSLGATIATEALISDQDRYQKIKFINDRSFPSLKAIIQNLQILKIFKFVLLFLLKICFWNIDILKQWKKLKNPKLICFSPSDEYIPFKASLYYEAQKNPPINAVILKNYTHCQKLSYHDMKTIFSKI